MLSLASPVLAFLRYAFLLRLEDRGRPSVACPFAGPRVHWTLGKSPAHPWQARSPGQASTGRLAFAGAPTPVRRVPFFACPKQATERKGTPDSAPANPAGPLAPHSSQTVRARAIAVPGPDARLAVLRSPCSCLQVRGSPSVASPLSRAKVHWTFVLIRFTVPRNFVLALRSPSSLGLSKGDKSKTTVRNLGGHACYYAIRRVQVLISELPSG